MIVRILKALVTKEKPDIIFLRETKASLDRIQYVARRLGFKLSFIVEAGEGKGGLALLWYPFSCGAYRSSVD